jgi:NAD(P)-dependent dehydrogenase (short-subunit alcohol dehydrogenase family)
MPTDASAGRVAGRTALVTGSTMGIGEAIVRRLAAEGARVLVHGPGLSEAEEVAAAIRAGGGLAEAVAGDLSDPLVPDLLASAAVDLLGSVDILVNNAALKTRGDLAATDAAAFDRMLAVNLRAPLLLIRALLPHFRAQGGATVLNIGSVNAYCGAPDLLAYSLSKGGLMTLSRNLADAYGAEGIRVNHLNLGWVLTPSEEVIFRDAGFPDGWDRHLPPEIAPSGSLLDPDDVAHFALSFVESSAHRVNGAVVELEQYPMIGRNPQKQAPAERRP